GIERLDSGGPQRLAGARSGPVAAARGPADGLSSGFEGDRCADVTLTVFRVCEIDPPGERAVGRRLEVRAAAKRRIDEEASPGTRIRSRHLDRPAVPVEAGRPVHVHEGRT